MRLRWRTSHLLFDPLGQGCYWQRIWQLLYAIAKLWLEFTSFPNKRRFTGTLVSLSLLGQNFITSEPLFIERLILISIFCKECRVI